MPQRRVAATGFGGNPALSILRGVAEGRLRREKTNRENQRSAILNRLTAANIERTEQAGRLAREQAERVEEEFADTQARADAATRTMKEFFIQERGMTPQAAEDAALARVGGFNTRFDIEKERLSLDQLETSTAVNRLSGEIKQDQLRNIKVDRAAMAIMADPRLLRVLDSDEISRDTKIGVVRETVPKLIQMGTFDEGFDMSLLDEAVIRAEDAVRRREREDVLGGSLAGQRGVRREARLIAREFFQAHGGDREEAIQDLMDQIRENPEERQLGMQALSILMAEDDEFGVGGLTVEDMIEGARSLERDEDGG